MFEWLREAEQAERMMFPKVKILQNSDCREKRPNYETTGTCEKTSESLYPDPWMDDGLYMTTDYNELYQKQYSYIAPFNRGLDFGTTGLRIQTSESLYPDWMDDGLYMMTDYNEGIRGQQEVPDSDGSDDELDLIDGGQLSSMSSYIDLTQSDCREKQSKYETRETHNKRMDDGLYMMTDYNEGMDNKLYKTTDYNELYQKQYPYHRPDITYYPPVGPVSAGTRPERPLASGSEPEPKVKPAEHHQTDTHDVITLMENKLSNMADLMKEREDAMMAHMKQMENKLSSMVDSMKEREDALMAHIKQTENKLSNMADLMKEREDAMMAHIKPKRLEEEGSDSTDPEHEPREEPSSHSDSDDTSSCMSFNSDRSMNRLVDFKGSRPSALKRKRDLEDEGSDSTESEPEPSDEPSSHSDSDDKSSCVSFNSDRLLNHITDFKGSRPSALKRKRNLEEERSDSIEPGHEPSSHYDSDDKSSVLQE